LPQKGTKKHKKKACRFAPYEHCLADLRGVLPRAAGTGEKKIVLKSVKDC
jgi:hypothetical protein